MSLMALNKIYESVRIGEANNYIERNDWFAVLETKVNNCFNSESKLYWL